MNFRTLLSIAWLGTSLPSLALATINHWQWEQLAKEKLATQSGRIQPSFKIPGYGAGTGQFTQRLDHDRAQEYRTFQQRYHFSSAYAEGPDSPVLYVMCGEGRCDADVFEGAPKAHARLLRAHLVALEHRYYGESIPFADLTADHLRYLKTDFALKDLERFQQYATRTLEMRGKWIAMGGSYSGSLAALYRTYYPKRVVGALASSAPIRAKVNFEEYDRHVAQAAGPECAAALRLVVHQIESSLIHPTELAAMKTLFHAEEIRDPLDFLAVTADMAAGAVQYGFRDELCKAVQGPRPLEEYARVGIEVLGLFNLTPVQDSFQGVESTRSSDYNGVIGTRQWMWQVCTEYGYFQNAFHDPELSVRSNLINLELDLKMCNHLFGLTQLPNETQINRHYLKRVQNRKTTQILFTNGSVDPWSELSITSPETAGGNQGLFTWLIEGASHCNDLGAGVNEAISDAQKRFQDLASQWLR